METLFFKVADIIFTIQGKSANELKKLLPSYAPFNIPPTDAKPALNNLKTEVANELGLSNYEQADKGNMTARQNGYVGGYMTKKLVEMAEQQLSGR